MPCSNPKYIDYELKTFPEALKEREAVVEKSLRDAMTVLKPAIKAFHEIKRYKLYRVSYPGYTFKQYCEKRWQRSGSAMYFLLAGRQIIAENSSTRVDKIPISALGRHVARLPKSKQKQVIEKLTTNNNSPTVNEARKAVDKELGITRKIKVPKELKDEFKRTGLCPVCGRQVYWAAKAPKE